MNYDTVFLVVDDMEGMRRILNNILKQIGMKHVETAFNGAEAWRIMQTRKIDVVISDWNMPVMSGLELLRKIRASERHADIPVLMMTSETGRYQVQAAIEAGVSGYLVKPFNASALESRIRRIIAQPHPTSLCVGQTPYFHAGTSQTDVAPCPGATVPAVLPFAGSGKSNTEARHSPQDPMKNEPKSALPLILVVDDIPDNLDILVDLLGDDYQVKAANSGERALKILRSGQQPDLILLDVMMPEMDGFEVCRRIKSNPETADIPVIFLSALNESINLAKGFEAGAVDFITKPADPPILKARITTHLKLRQSFIELKQSRLALMEQNAVLEDNLRLREEVERIAQHDLKNPIAGIISFASILQDDKKLDPDQIEIIGYIEQSAYNVLNMVNLSLDLYKMERGNYQFFPNAVDLRAIIERIIKEKSSEMASREIQIGLQTLAADGTGAADGTADAALPKALGDELLCYSMFGNLFNNAMEAAPGSSRIEIVLHSTAHTLFVEMTNQGVVPQQIRNSFFEKFATAGKPGGTGLGAFSARLIARTQGGDIAMQTSDQTHSTTITVTLPTLASVMDADADVDPHNAAPAQS